MNSLELLSEFETFLQKKKDTGKKIIAFLGHDNIPIELLEAADFFPLRMIFAGDDQLMNSSNTYLPPSTCSFAQSCIGYFTLTPRTHKFLEYVDYFLLSNHCVSDICVSEIISDVADLKRLDFYVPYYRNENASKYYKIELTNLKNEIEKLTRERIPDYKIRDSIIKQNDFKKVVKDISNLKIKGYEKLKLYQKAMLFGPNVQPELERIVEKHRDHNEINLKEYKNLLLTGCSIFIDDFLIDLIDESGGNIVHFDTWIGHQYYSQIFSQETLEKIQDPYKLLIKRFETNVYGDHCISHSLENQINSIINYINQFKKENPNMEDVAVLNHIIKFCDHFSLFQSTFKQKLQEKGVKVLNLERDYSRAMRGQLRTRIEAFMEMI
ncbi:MAG: 2-hydroxyacyl-CoA dehydratase [Promethearchaeota archaeon]|nr:MAG: 2-hydroxyacyl-CoA dehydratase [Candidatus Lokiarchaeota archaeon]